MFADDSSTVIRRIKQIAKARVIIRKYEKATGAALHDGKTKLAKLGRRRGRELTNEMIGVKFKIMTEDQVEEYLGDVIGNNVGEEERFGEKNREDEETGREVEQGRGWHTWQGAGFQRVDAV